MLSDRLVVLGFWLKKHYYKHSKFLCVIKYMKVYLVSIYTYFVLQVYACYLPPEGYMWANSTQLFGHFAQLCYLVPFFFCCVFNARTGCLKDCIDDIDNIPQRNVIDTNTNAYGKQFLDFLQESNMCILSGTLHIVMLNLYCRVPKT